jgi:type II secretory pathway component PulF
MPTTFTYTAVNAKGKAVSGSVPADSRSAAIAAVIGKGLSPINVVESGKADKSKAAPVVVPGAKIGRVKPRIIEDFTRELASLLAGGVPLARALSLLKREAKDPHALALWNQIHSDVVEGNSLADSLA